MPRQATEIWSHEFVRRHESLDPAARRRVTGAVRDQGQRLEDFPHQRMQGFKCFRLRVGDHRVIYDFSVAENSLGLISVGHRREVYR